MVDMSGKRVWMDGDFVDYDGAKVSVLSQTLHYGLGAFEGIRCYKLSDGGSAIFQLKAHVHRMFNTAKIISLEPSFTEQEIAQAHIDTVKENKLEECYLRPIMYCDTGGMGLGAINRTRIAIAAWEWGSYLGEGALEKGIRAKVSSFNRHHVNVGMVQGKIVGQYVTSILAKREAMAAGYDEAIMLDTEGYVAEGTGENIFVVKDGVVYTPPFNSPILPGITRNTVVALAHEMKCVLHEEKFTRDFLYISDEIFLTGTAAEITPVREVDDRKVGDGRPGPITQRFQKAFFDVVRGNYEHHRDLLAII